jgi:hypothetical protein
MVSDVYCVHSISPRVSALLMLVTVFRPIVQRFLKIHFNITFPSTTLTAKWFPSFRFSDLTKKILTDEICANFSGL